MTSGSTLHQDRATDKTDLQLRLILLAGRRIAAGLVALQTGTYLLNELVLDGRIAGADADAENTALAWLGSTAIFAGALLAFLLACSSAQHRSSLILLSGALAYLSLDEALGVHERVGVFIQEDLLGLEDLWVRVAWPVALMPMLAIVVILLWRIRFEQPRTTAVVRRGVALLAAALLAEMLGGLLHIEGPDEGWANALQVAFEEGLELGGWILVASGLAAAVRSAAARQPRRQTMDGTPAAAPDGVFLIRTVGQRLAVVAAVALMSAFLVNAYALDAAIDSLEATAEYNLWSWAASMATFAAAIGSFGGAALAPRSERPPWLALGGVLAFLSLDDFIVIHERLGQSVGDALGLPSFVGPRIWTLMYLPLVAVVFTLFLFVRRRLPAPDADLAARGLVLLVVGFLFEGVGIATKFVYDAGFAAPHLIRSGVEESIELAGWCLLATALTAALLGALQRLEEE